MMLTCRKADKSVMLRDGDTNVSVCAEILKSSIFYNLDEVPYEKVRVEISMGFVLIAVAKSVVTQRFFRISNFVADLEIFPL
jgi:hypothetical protein